MLSGIGWIACTLTVASTAYLPLGRAALTSPMLGNATAAAGIELCRWSDLP